MPAKKRYEQTAAYRPTSGHDKIQGKTCAVRLGIYEKKNERQQDMVEF